MRKYFNLKEQIKRTEAAILVQINQVAKNHNYKVRVVFYSNSICISSKHFMTTIYDTRKTQLNMLCSGNLPVSLEDKLASVTKMHEAEQEHVKVINAILKVL